MTTDLWTCPRCGGHHCGALDGLAQPITYRCHDEFFIGCKWEGTDAVRAIAVTALPDPEVVDKIRGAYRVLREEIYGTLCDAGTSPIDASPKWMAAAIRVAIRVAKEGGKIEHAPRATADGCEPFI